MLLAEIKRTHPIVGKLAREQWKWCVHIYEYVAACAVRNILLNRIKGHVWLWKETAASVFGGMEILMYNLKIAKFNPFFIFSESGYSCNVHERTVSKVLFGEI